MQSLEGAAKPPNTETAGFRAPSAFYCLGSLRPTLCTRASLLHRERVSAAFRPWFLLSSPSRSRVSESAPWETSSLLIFSPSEVFSQGMPLFTDIRLSSTSGSQGFLAHLGNKPTLLWRAPLSVVRAFAALSFTMLLQGDPLILSKLSPTSESLALLGPLPGTQFPQIFKHHLFRESLLTHPALRNTSLCSQLSTSLFQSFQSYSPTCNFLSVCSPSFLQCACHWPDR